MLFKILISIYRCKFIFKKPKACNLIVFDDTSIEYLKNILNGRQYFTLITRSENLKNIYLTQKLYFIYYVILGVIYFQHTYAHYFKVISPSIVITYIDNSPRFHI